jgi:hypothetical protein
VSIIEQRTEMTAPNVMDSHLIFMDPLIRARVSRIFVRPVTLLEEIKWMRCSILNSGNGCLSDTLNHQPIV